MPITSIDSVAAPEQLLLILQELGPDSPDIAAVAQDGEASWIVQFENEAIVHATWRTGPDRLEMMSPVVRLAVDGQAQTLRALLMFSFMSGDTGGCRMGLSALDDTAYLIRDLPVSALSLAEVRSALRGTADLARQWSAVMGGMEVVTDGLRIPGLPFAL